MIEENELESIEFENPEQKPEISDESLSHLEDQIKKVAELTEKLNFATDTILDAAEKLPKAENSEEAEEVAEEEPIPETDEVAEEEFADDLLDEDMLAEEELADSEEEASDGSSEILDEPLDESILGEEESSENAETEAETLAEEELLTEEDLSDESESEDFLEDIPDALTGEPEGAEEESEQIEEHEDLEESEELESPTSAEEDLAMKRAVDMLPTISASIEDRSVIYKFREYLELFKTLRDMLDYLPPSQKKEFMLSKNRVMLDFIISKLSGKAGLFATSKALIRSGLLHENENARGQDLEGVALAREVIDHLRELSGKLDDDYLRDALDTEAMKLLEQF